MVQWYKNNETFVDNQNIYVISLEMLYIPF